MTCPATSIFLGVSYHHQMNGSHFPGVSSFRNVLPHSTQSSLDGLFMSCVAHREVSLPAKGPLSRGALSLPGGSLGRHCSHCVVVFLHCLSLLSPHKLLRVRKKVSSSSRYPQHNAWLPGNVRNHLFQERPEEPENPESTKSSQCHLHRDLPGADSVWSVLLGAENSVPAPDSLGRFREHIHGQLILRKKMTCEPEIF